MLHASLDLPFLCISISISTLLRNFRDEFELLGEMLHLEKKTQVEIFSKPFSLVNTPFQPSLIIIQISHSVKKSRIEFSVVRSRVQRKIVKMANFINFYLFFKIIDVFYFMVNWAYKMLDYCAQMLEYWDNKEKNPRL